MQVSLMPEGPQPSSDVEVYYLLWPPTPYVDILYLINVDNKSTCLYNLPTKKNVSAEWLGWVGLNFSFSFNCMKSKKISEHACLLDTWVYHYLEYNVYTYHILCKNIVALNNWSPNDAIH